MERRRLLQTPYELVGLGMCSNYFRRERATEILGHTSETSCKMLCDNNVRPVASVPLIRITVDPLPAKPV